MVDLLVALVEFFIQFLVLVIELIGGLIGLVFGWLDRTGSPARTASSGDPTTPSGAKPDQLLRVSTRGSDPATKRER
jgi:hypothetical protein